MNKQEMLEKYAGMLQFQISIDKQQADELLAHLTTLLDLVFDQTAYEKARDQAVENDEITVYYARSKRNPLSMVLIEFWKIYSCTVIIRLPQDQEQRLRHFLQQYVEQNELFNCLVEQSAASNR